MGPEDRFGKHLSNAAVFGVLLGPSANNISSFATNLLMVSQCTSVSIASKVNQEQAEMAVSLACEFDR